MSRELTVVLNGRRAGILTQGAGGVLAFGYDTDYRSFESALPLSLSLPLTQASYAGAGVRAYCQGLLPDNENVLERWGREFQVSAGNPFALLNHVGEDCAGAAQFVSADRVEAMLAHEGKVVPLTEEQVADRLRRHVPAPAASGDEGRLGVPGRGDHRSALGSLCRAQSARRRAGAGADR